MPSSPGQNCSIAPGAPTRPALRPSLAPQALEPLSQPGEVAQAIGGSIRAGSGQALKAQANSLPRLACLLLAGSQRPGN